MNTSGCGVAIVLAAVVMATTGLICQFPHCGMVKCNFVDPENCTGTIRMGGGYCGCCKACFTEVGAGETCEKSKDPVDALFYPPTVLCETGFYCEHNTSTCEPLPGFSLG